MAEDKKGFILYSDQQELFNQLSDEQAGKLIKHIYAYVNDENPECKDIVTKLAFTPIKQQFKRDLEKWEKTRGLRSKAGLASAKARRNKKQQKATHVNTVQHTSTNPTVNDNVNVNVNVNDNVNVNKSIEDRKAEFKNSLLPFLDEYDKDLVKDFFLYWSEHNDNGKKMRYELSKNQPFNRKRRLSTWLKKQNQYDNKNQTELIDGFRNPVNGKININELTKKLNGTTD